MKTKTELCHRDYIEFLQRLKSKSQAVRHETRPLTSAEILKALALTFKENDPGFNIQQFMDAAAGLKII